RIFPERLRERRAALDVAGDARRHIAQRLRIVLLREDLEALRDGEAGVYHRRELSSIDRQVLVPDASAEFLRGRGGNRLDGFFLYRGRDDALRSEGGDGGGTAFRLDVARHGTPTGAPFVCEHSHTRPPAKTA